MECFDVVLRLDDGRRTIAGSLTIHDARSNGRYKAEFHYHRSWLEAPDRFALDPESLPLTAESFISFNLNPPLGAFRDALPEAWGRKLLFEKRQLFRRTDEELVFLRGRNGIGAIEFVAPGGATSPPSESSAATALELPALVQLAEEIESGRPIPDSSLLRLTAVGSAAGGSRPKVALVHAGAQWIAKFPSRRCDGRFDVVGLEKAAMDCARLARMRVADTRILSFASARVLLVKRFDISALGGRHHMLSFATLCRERSDNLVSSYDDLADAVRKHSCSPACDLERLFRHALFNALIGNADDHLRNFAMIHTRRGYRLSPAYDLLPDYLGNREGALFFGYQRYLESAEAALVVGLRWGIRDAATILNQVTSAASLFGSLAERAGVPRQNIDEIVADIDRRTALANGHVTRTPTVCCARTAFESGGALSDAHLVKPKRPLDRVTSAASR